MAGSLRPHASLTPGAVFLCAHPAAARLGRAGKALLAERAPFLAADLAIAVLVDLGEGRHAFLALRPRAQKLLGEHLLAGRDVVELRVRAQARFARIDEAVVVLIAFVLDLLGGSRIAEIRAKPERQGKHRRSQ